MDPLGGSHVRVGRSGTTIAKPHELLTALMPCLCPSSDQECSKRGMMSKPIEAIYENSVLSPLEPLGLEEHQRVTVTIAEDGEGQEDLFDPEFTQWCAEQSRHAPSLEEVRQT